MTATKGFNKLKNEIIDNGLCARCGACIGVCPTQCISYKSENNYTPYLSKENCIGCDKCNKVCPGSGYTIMEKHQDYEYSNKIGSYKKLYTGFSANEKILNNCASGGIITSLLVYLFENNKIDFAIVVTNSKDGEKGFSRGIIARSIEEVLQASQSKYANVATLDLVRDIRTNNNISRGVIVGVPCQLAAISKIMEIDDVVAKKILYRIGLFCGYTYTEDCYKYLFRYMGIVQNEVKYIEGWRCDGIPGNFRIMTENNSVAVTFQEEHSLDTILFAQNRCMLCEDCFADYCDIAVGDVGHNKYRDSLIIARTHKGNEILEIAQEHKAINITERTYEYVINNTIVNFMVREKREKVEIRRKLYKRKKMKTVDWKNVTSKYSLASDIVVKIQYYARKDKIKRFILKNSKRHYKICKMLYLGLENSILIRGLRKIERYIRHE